MLTNSFLAIGSEDGCTSCPACVGSAYFQGLMDEVAVYNRALGANEIHAIYDARGNGKSASGTLVPIIPPAQPPPAPQGGSPPPGLDSRPIFYCPQ